MSGQARGQQRILDSSVGPPPTATSDDLSLLCHRRRFGEGKQARVQDVSAMFTTCRIQGPDRPAPTITTRFHSVCSKSSRPVWPLWATNPKFEARLSPFVPRGECFCSIFPRRLKGANSTDVGHQTALFQKCPIGNAVRTPKLSAYIWPDGFPWAMGGYAVGVGHICAYSLRSPPVSQEVHPFGLPNGA